MSKDDVKDTTESEVKGTPETTENNSDQVEEVAETPPEKKETIGEIHKDTDSKKPDQVPMARLDKEIKKRKDLEAEVQELKEQLASPDPEEEKVDESAIQRLEKEIDQMKAKEAQKELNRVIGDNIAQALEEVPEYKDVVNVNVLAGLAKDPANKDKTYIQLIEEAYGNAIGGKRTIETTTPRGGADPEKVDMEKTRRDPEYRKRVLQDPELRKQYNEADGGIENRINL